MKKITATGRDEIARDFYYVFEEENPKEQDSNPKSWQIRVYSQPDGCDEFFEMVLDEYQEYYQIVMAAHHDQEEYKAKGIPEAIILEILNKRNKPIHSSTRIETSNDGRNSRSEQATKYWKRLVDLGKASYFPEEDIYKTIRES